MSGVRSEHRHHTDEQIRDALAFAAALVEELELADDLRVSGFTKAAELRAAKTVEVTHAMPQVPGMAIPRGL